MGNGGTAPRFLDLGIDEGEWSVTLHTEKESPVTIRQVGCAEDVDWIH
jgi:hypothetical protein